MNSIRAHHQVFTNISHLVIVNRCSGAVAHDGVHSVKHFPPRVKSLVEISSRIINRRAYSVASPDNPICYRSAGARPVAISWEIIRDADTSSVRLTLVGGEVMDVAVAFCEGDVNSPVRSVQLWIGRWGPWMVASPMGAGLTEEEEKEEQSRKRILNSSFSVLSELPFQIWTLSQEQNCQRNVKLAIVRCLGKKVLTIFPQAYIRNFPQMSIIA
jgi:hypothetical protein